MAAALTQLSGGSTADGLKAGAIGAITASAMTDHLVSALYGDKKSSDLTAEEKRLVSSLVSIAGGLAGAAVTDGSVSMAATASETAKVEVENNSLSPGHDEEELEKEHGDRLPKVHNIARPGVLFDEDGMPRPGTAGLGIGAVPIKNGGGVAKGAQEATRFIDGMRIVDQKTGQIFQGKIDLGPTLERIASGGSFPHRNDGSVYQNRSGALPQKTVGYYTEYVHPTNGIAGPGPQRIVVGKGGEMFYTPDHYKTFIPIKK